MIAQRSSDFAHLTLACTFGLLAQMLVGLPSSEAEIGPRSLNLPPTYAATVWPAGHRDAGNTDYVPMVMSRSNRIAKHILQGHPIFWPPLSGPEGHFYVTSGKGPGHSHLHALTSDGELLWEAAPQRSLDDLDSYAIINAPVVDRAGDVYVGDRNQLWAFRPNGEVKWVAALEPHGVAWGFMTVVLSSHGYVGGISTEGKVLFFRRDNGELAMPALDLPGGPGPAAEDSPPRWLWRDLMDPAIKPFIFNLIQGWEMEVANTPSLHPTDDRVYITAAGIQPGTGLLYGIDVHEDHLELAFQTEMGAGSGTSPAVSHDGERVYALDELGRMVAVSASTGARLWQADERGGGSASPSVGPDGVVYTAFQDHLLAFGADGPLLWRHDYNDFCAEHVPAPTGFWSWIFSPPVAFVDSLVTLAATEGWINVVCGYHIELLPSRSERTLVPVPQKSFVVAIDLESGAPFPGSLQIPETSEGFITPTLDGNTFVTLSGAITSIFYHALNWLLPRRLEVPHEPKAGLLLLEPVSRTEHARRGLRWLARRNYVALVAVGRGDFGAAGDILEETRLQLAATRSVLERIATNEGLVSARVERQHELLDEIESLQTSLTESLVAGAVATDETTMARTTKLRRVHSLLEELSGSL